MLSISLDSLAAASQTVAPVPVDYRYEFSVDWTTVGGLGCSANVLYNRGGTVSDSEGHNGLPYRTDGLSDSRVATERLCDNLYARPQFVPLKYGGAQGGLTPITVASGVEGALIQAEASLKSGAGAEWLTILNQLRATVVTPALAPLDDPGTPETRLALLFKERAYWLFLTGHRQGDLRRLIRQYHHAPTAVFPTGQYPVGPGTPAQYSTDVTFPMPIAERNNPLFHGCLDRGA